MTGSIGRVAKATLSQGCLPPFTRCSLLSDQPIKVHEPSALHKSLLEARFSRARNVDFMKHVRWSSNYGYRSCGYVRSTYLSFVHALARRVTISSVNVLPEIGEGSGICRVKVR